MKIWPMQRTILILSCLFSLNTGYGQAATDGCQLPVFRYAWVADTSDIVLKYEDLVVRYKMDSTYLMNNPTIMQSGNDSTSGFTCMNGFATFTSNDVSYAIYTDATNVRVLSANKRNCMVRDVVLRDGRIYSDFHCDYSKPDTCIIITYKDGKPDRFSEGKPYSFRTLEDSASYRNGEYDIIMTRSGWYDDEAKKHYYPTIR